MTDLEDMVALRDNPVIIVPVPFPPAAAAKLAEGSRVRSLYGSELVYERHRHRWEVNNRYRKDLESAGLRLSGLSPDDNLVEYIEMVDHPYFVATQAHPEFRSRPDVPHPLFAGLMEAAAEHRRGVEGGRNDEIDLTVAETRESRSV